MDIKMMEATVERLNSKAAESTDSGDAMRFAQAALNAANAYAALAAAKGEKRP